jgi:DNA-binding NarL/FixJ family response regulator
MYASIRDASEKPRSVSVGVIEPQRLFAPFLTQLLSEAGFCVVTTLESMALDEIARNEPTVIFVDVDFIDVEPVLAIRQLRTVVPNATICVYTGRSQVGWAATCSRAGANCVISKSAMPAEIVAGIQQALRVGAFIDERFDVTSDNENDRQNSVKDED